MKIKVNDLTSRVVSELHIPRGLAKEVVKSIAVGIDYGVGKIEEKARIKGPIATTDGLCLDTLPKQALITNTVAYTGINRPIAKKAIESVQNYIIEALRKGYEVEVENIGKYRVSPRTKKINERSSLLFEPVPYPKIPPEE